jgi:hypothetical protein
MLAYLSEGIWFLYGINRWWVEVLLNRTGINQADLLLNFWEWTKKVIMKEPASEVRTLTKLVANNVCFSFSEWRIHEWYWFGSHHIRRQTQPLRKDMSRNNTTPCRLLLPPSYRHRHPQQAACCCLNAWACLIRVDLKLCVVCWCLISGCVAWF